MGTLLFLGLLARSGAKTDRLGRALEAFRQTAQSVGHEGIGTMCRTFAAVGAFAEQELFGSHCFSSLPSAPNNVFSQVLFLPQPVGVFVGSVSYRTIC